MPADKPGLVTETRGYVMAMSSHEMLVGRYELRGVLGCGGMAEVRDGWDTRLDRAVAIKLLHPALNAQPGIRRRFEHEARSAAALSHPNIVSVYDCGDDRGRPFIVMERLPGNTLHDDIAQGPLPPKRVGTVLDEVLAALTAAHAAGVLHRDIKPGNILVSFDGLMKVADFGIAKTAGADHTMTGQVVGTMAYMSPERIAGAPASAADDLYSVGLVGYEALTGHRPFPQENPATLAHAIMSAPPPAVAATRRDVDPVIAAVIDRAMTRDPRQRFRTAAQMRAALGGDSRALSVGLAPGSSPRRPPTKVLPDPLPRNPLPHNQFHASARRPRRLSRNQKFLAAAAVFVASIVTLVAFATDPSSSPPVTEPVSTSTPVSTPSPPPPPPSVSSAAPVYQPPAAPNPGKSNAGKKGGEKKGGRG